MKVWRGKSVFSVTTLAGAVLLLFHSLAHGQRETIQVSRSLPTDVPVAVEVVGDKDVSYVVNLTADEFFQVRLEQEDSEILLRLLDSSGNEVARMSSPREESGLETLSF